MASAKSKPRPKPSSEPVKKFVTMAYGGQRMNGNDHSVVFYTGPRFEEARYFEHGKSFQGMLVGQLMAVPCTEKSYAFHDKERLDTQEMPGWSEDRVDEWRVADAACRALVSERKHLKDLQDLEHVRLGDIARKMKYMKTRERNALFRQIMMYLVGESL